MLVVSAVVLIAAVGGIWWGLWEQHREVMRMHMQIRMANALITELLEGERRRQRAEERQIIDFLA